MELQELKLDELDMLKSLMDDFNEAIELRMMGEQNSMYFTRKEMSFLRGMLEKRIREVS